jgi:hypothetical protein
MNIETTTLWLVLTIACALAIHLLSVAEKLTRKPWSDRACVFGMGFFFACTLLCAGLTIWTLL